MEIRLTRIGDYTFATNPHDIYIGKSLEVYGEFSYGEILLIEQLLKPHANVIEAGANVGSHTVFLGREVCPKGTIYAFEPRRLTFQLLCANVAVNGLENVHAFAEGLGQKTERISEGPLPTDGRKENFGGIKIGALPGEDETLEITALDDRLDWFAPISLIKADVEGWERDVLLGGEKLIARDRPILYLENHHEELSEPLIRTVMDMDYNLWWHCPFMFRSDNRAGNDFNIFGRTWSVNMLCVPAERNIKADTLRQINDPTDRPA